MREGVSVRVFDGLFEALLVEAGVLVVQLFELFEFVGRERGASAFFPQQPGERIDELGKRPGPVLGEWAIVDALGLLGELLFVLANEQLGVTHS